MIDYNVVYVAIWIMAIFSVFIRSDWSRYLFYIQATFMALFLAFRFETGYDWPVYKSHYLHVAAGETFQLNFEIGYEYLVRIFTFLGFEFHQFVALLSVLEILLIAVSVRFFFRKHSIWVMALLYSIPDFYLIPSFSLVRQALAASLFFYGLHYYARARLFTALGIFVLAVSVHYSVVGAIAFLVLAMRVRLSKYVFVVLFAVAVTLYLFSIDVARFFANFVVLYFYPKYIFYLERDVYNASFVYRLVYAAVSTLVFALIYTSWDKRLVDSSGFSKWDSTVYRLAMFGVLIPLVVFGFPTFSTRYQYFFCIFMVGVSLSVLVLFNARDRLAIMLAVCVISYVSFYRFLVNPLSIVYVPYQSQFLYDEKNSTGQKRTDDLLHQLEILWLK
ncbi:EpsG family protein [Pseudomonas sp. L1(2025)]|uniref:EpsG family protein n=1 Tax=Pseudomonas sp. L1(2025) TaxID=3449429 RepID=UPI003F690A58